MGDLNESFPNLYKRATVMICAVDEALFPDGYCVCRCGPVHHRVWFDHAYDKARLFCNYHRVECGHLTADQLRAYVTRRGP